MSIVSVTIPQIGEGLQEARIVSFLKKPGDFVKRDEPLYQMETDKAVMDVESPYEGTLVSWSAKVDDVVPIGGEICQFDVGGGAASSDVVAPESVAAAEVMGDATSEFSLTIPQIGEGLQEARIVAFLKQAGDAIKRDEPIYQMETDKAIMDVESPVEGTLIEWTAKVDQVVAIGAEIGRVAITGAAPAPAAGHAPSSSSSAAGAVKSKSVGATKEAASLQGIPPRTRAYAREKGVSEADLMSIPFATRRLMPTDIDAFLAGGGVSAVSSSGHAYSESAIGGKQRVLNSRMVRSNSLVVPGTMTVVTKWSPIEEARAALKAKGGSFQPSAFTMFAYAVTRTLAEFPTFRTVLAGDDKLRTYENVSLGIAVALPGDELVIAVVDKADTLDWPAFAAASREKIDIARGGKDQAHEAVTVSLTNMQAAGLRNAVPVVVAPSIATLFIGEVFRDLDSAGRMQKVINLTMTFDHRVVNGMGAANFLNEIRKKVENIGEVLA